MSFSDPQEKNNKISERVNEECKLKPPLKMSQNMCFQLYIENEFYDAFIQKSLDE